MDEDLRRCNLCEWGCGVDRAAGELGVCLLGQPQVASRTLHPAPPSSFTIFMAGCNFRCLHCQNWEIAHWPATGKPVDGPLDASALAREALTALASPRGASIRADRLFFSGGEPTCSLPYVEEVAWHARQLDPTAKVNFDTNGFLTDDSLRRVLSWTTSVTFDLRAVDDEVHRALVGAPVAPVLRNARLMAEHPDKLWEFRVLLVPGINEDEVEGLCRYVAALGSDLPVHFLAFRPEFVLHEHLGAPTASLDRAVSVGRDCGLRNVSWSGRPDLPPGAGLITPRQATTLGRGYSAPGALLAGAYARCAGCITAPRDCGACRARLHCRVKAYTPVAGW